MANYSFGRQHRLQHLYRHGAGLFTVPLDHSVSSGPIASVSGLDKLVGQLASNGVDAVVLHKGRIRHIDHRWFNDMALIIHMSASTSRAPNPDGKYLVATVEEALRLGADAVSVHVNLGSADESQQIADLAAVADACSLWNMPLMAMMYPRGPLIKNPNDPDLVSHAAALAADLGADLVKTVYVGNVDAMKEVVRGCPVPIVVAGGAHLGDVESTESFVQEVMSTGVEGIAMGRNIFQATDPATAANRIAEIVHGSLAIEPDSRRSITSLVKQLAPTGQTLRHQHM